MTPTIILDRCVNKDVLNFQSLKIMSDHVIVMEDDRDLDIADALACLMAVYYVFGLEYPKHLRNTLIFIEHFLCEMPTTSKIPIPVVKLHTSLN